MKMSYLEQRFATALMAFGKDLPPAQREYRFAPPRRWRFDWCWEAEKVAVEIDGGYFRPDGGRHNTKSDREKLAAAKRLGYHVLHFTAPELRDSETVIETVRAVLNSRKGLQ